MRNILALTLMVLLSACAPSATASGNCMVSGCSGQLCVKKGEDQPSTCEWSASYACYKQFGACEQQTDGNCGWSKTYDLIQCLKDPDNYAGNALRPETQRDQLGSDRRNPWMRP